MGKWADYLICAVKYNQDRSLITEMKLLEDKEDGVGEEMVVTRATVADKIKKRKKYMTVFSSGSNWQQGNEVRVFIVDGNYYVRSDNNKVSRDNLGPLPEF